jgi:hypothetical protein
MKLKHLFSPFLCPEDGRKVSFESLVFPPPPFALFQTLQDRHFKILALFSIADIKELTKF